MALANAQAILPQYGLNAATLDHITLGNINETYQVQVPTSRYILQRLNPIFAPEVHYDIEAATRHLQAAGLVTPRLVPTLQGRLWVETADGEIWRLQTFIPGQVLSSNRDPARCQAAGFLLGRFHAALADLPLALQGTRPSIHDTPGHLAGLSAALDAHRGHVAYDQVAPLAEQILHLAAQLPTVHGLPARLVHGDPKLNNIIFAEDGSARALIDLDTLGRMPLVLELGDAWRSWCNPGGEDRSDSGFALELFAASLEGYASTARSWLTPAEADSLERAVDTIALELGARFARDVLEERYFSWDRVRYQAAWQHNLVRARSQLQVATSYQAQHDEVRSLLARVLQK